MRQDSIHNFDLGDTLFVPLYLYRDTTLLSADSARTPAFRDYVTQLLNDSLPVVEPEPSLLQQKTFVSHPQMPLKPLQEQQSRDWEFVSLFVILALLAVFFKFFPHGIFEIIRSCFSTKEFEVMTKSGNPLLLPTSILFFPIVALLAFTGLNYFDIPLKEIFNMANRQIVVLFVLAAVVFIVVKMLLVLFFGTLFRCKNLAKGYIINQMSFLFLDSLVLFLPVTLSLFVSSHLQYPFLLLSCGLFALLSLIRTLRGLYVVFNTSKFSRIYFFLLPLHRRICAVVFNCKGFIHGVINCLWQ